MPCCRGLLAELAPKALDRVLDPVLERGLHVRLSRVCRTYSMLERGLYKRIRSMFHAKRFI